MSEIDRSRLDAAISALPSSQLKDNLSQVLAFSSFAKKIFERYQQKVYELVHSGDLARSYTANDVSLKLAKLTNDVEGQAELDDVLRSFRHIEMLRILWREMAGLTDVEASMQELSSLADALIAAACEKHQRWLIDRYGQPCVEGTNEYAHFVVFGLGKLGGGELNFSSDVDLIFAYSAVGFTDGKKSISNNEFFLKLGQKIVGTLNEVTHAGFVYRVDMRLRPNGQSGPLVMSFAAMENYYQIHGREWERYAWVKARCLAGDQQTGDDFLQRIRPFVYRKYLDYQVYDSLEQMKALINQEIQQTGMQYNIKLGRGGIREIEFIVQSHQLVRGGRIPGLRTRSLKKALAQLVEYELINEIKANRLYQCYLLLRTVEHRLQMKADQQTHKLPGEDSEFEELAMSLDETAASLVSQLSECRDFVHNEFVQLHSESEPEQARGDWELLWQSAHSNVNVSTELTEQEISAAVSAYANSKAYRMLEVGGRKAIDQLIPRLLELTASLSQPTLTLHRLFDILAAIGGRTGYLILLVQNPPVCQKLVQLCSASAWISGWIAAHPIVLDTLINPRQDQYVFNNVEIKAQYASSLAQESDSELKHDLLRQFHHSSILQIAIAEIQKQYSATEVRELITDTAVTIINHVVSLCQDEIKSRFGQPVAKHDEDSFAVIAYGKLGSKELGYQSDLDLVFVYDDEYLEDVTVGGRKSVSVDYYYSRLVQRIITMLGMQTAAGKLYDVDTRLRPSGSSGLLVTSISQFAKYQLESAWNWEHQAIIKARVISNASALSRKFLDIRQQVLTIRRSQSQLASDISSMREKILKTKGEQKKFSAKFNSGGMIDIEFICQYFVLLYAADHRQLLSCRSVVEILSCLGQCKLYDGEKLSILLSTYNQILAWENREKINLDHEESLIQKLQQSMNQSRLCWQELFV